MARTGTTVNARFKTERSVPFVSLSLKTVAMQISRSGLKNGGYPTIAKYTWNVIKVTNKIARKIFIIFPILFALLRLLCIISQNL